MTIQKEYLGPDAFLNKCFRLARQIHDTGYCPDLIVGLWRGGAPVAMAIHEFFAYRGLAVRHAVLQVSSYHGIGKRSDPTVLHDEAVIDWCVQHDKVLLVDDILDTGQTLAAMCERLKDRVDAIRIATLYYKPDQNQTDIVPDYYGEETRKWIVFPHELVGLSPEEVRQKDPALAAWLSRND